MTKHSQLIDELLSAHHSVVNAEVALEKEYDDLGSNAVLLDRAFKAQKRFDSAMAAIKNALDGKMTE